MTTPLHAIITTDAPAAIGPYSQAVRAGDWLYVSGQIPLDPATGELAGGNDIRVAARQALANLRAVLAAAGAGFERVVKTTVYLRDLEDFGRVNEVYAETFSGPVKPARACIQAARLPRDAAVEIDAIAWLG